MSTAADNWPYSAREAAARLGISERTIRRAIARGELVATKRAGVFRITPEALTTYSHQRQRSSLPGTTGSRRQSQRFPETNAAPHPLHLVRQAGGPGFDLPRPLTPFLGRDREIAAIVAALSQPGLRLLTLTGPGGVGKTRLALQAAQEMAPRFADGVAFVPLAPVIDAALVPFAVAQALGVRNLGERPIRERVTAALGGRQSLLVLDNFEHVLPAATFATDLLGACPALTVLVTSRTALGVSGEHRFPAPPMALPDAAVATSEAVHQVDAVRLFVARAQAVLPSFVLTNENAGTVSEICRHLDGLPLAIELAAARLPTLPPRALLARLERRLPLLTGGPRDAPARLQTMRKAITWSYDLLSEDEQRLFRRLSVFTGGFTLEAAENVGGDGLTASGGEETPAAPPKGAMCPAPLEAESTPPERGHSPAVMEGIASLVTSSLLQQEEGSSGEPRYAMLETIREYGLEKLAQAGEETETRQRHAAHFLALCDRGYPNHFGPFTDIDRRHQQLEVEQPNLRAAFAFLVSVGGAESVLRLAGALALFWLRRGHQREGRQWLEWALAHTATAQTEARCRALAGLGTLLWVQGEHEQAASATRAALAIAEVIDVAEVAALAIHTLGLLAEERQAWEEAEALFVDALARWHALDAWAEEGVALAHLSAISFSRGDHDLAVRHAEASLARFRSSGYASGAGMALCRRAHLARVHGDGHAAARDYHEALALWSSQNDHWYIMLALAGLAELASAYGQPSVAATLLGSIDAVVQAAGAALLSSARPNYDRAAVVARAALGKKRFDEQRAAGLLLSPGEAVAIAAAIPLPAAPPGGMLTARETEILRLIDARRTDPEIAGILYVSQRTVNAHVRHILDKLQVPSRRAAVERGRELGLLERAAPARNT